MDEPGIGRLLAAALRVIDGGGPESCKCKKKKVSEARGSLNVLQTDTPTAPRSKKDVPVDNSDHLVVQGIRNEEWYPDK